MDLRSHYPRSPTVQLGGYVHLARMIDKCRAVLAGTMGDYIYPCPMDNLLLKFVGVTHGEFLHAVREHSDEATVQWLSRHGTTHSADDIAQWNESLLTRSPDTEEKLAYFSECLAKVAPTRTDITSWADLLDIEEGRPVPLRSLA